MGTRYHFDGGELRRRRIALNLKPEHVALGIERGTETVIHLELGRSDPRMCVFLKLCDLLDCQPGDLIRPVKETTL